MKTLHTIEIDAADIAAMKAGQVLQIAEDTVLAYALRKVVRPARLDDQALDELHVDDPKAAARIEKKRRQSREYYRAKQRQAGRKVVERFSLSDAERRQRKQAYMKAYMKTYRPKHGRPVVGPLTEEQLMRQPHATKDGKYRCRVCPKEYGTWAELKAHLATHLGKGGEA